jgi:hypothetical protein
VIVTGPVTVGVVTWVCGNLGLLFCRRPECRCRPVTISVLRAAWLAVSASRASTAGEVAAVTWVWTMDRAASRRGYQHPALVHVVADVDGPAEHRDVEGEYHDEDAHHNGEPRRLLPRR